MRQGRVPKRGKKWERKEKEVDIPIENQVEETLNTACQFSIHFLNW